MRIRTLVMDETLDAAILKVLVEKAARIRRDYGFSPPYFGDETTILDLLRQHNVKLGPKQLTLFGSRSKRDGASVDPFAEESLERIKGDSFYGQTNISLSEIEERLEETAQTVGSPEEIRRFVFSGLDRFGCSRTKNADGSYRIALTLPALQTAAMGAVIERATFDPEWALDDPDMTLLDVGHPLVRRLIEEVKQRAFHAEEHYGRTAYVVTPDVNEATVLVHLLARYVVNTAPTSIIEELLPVAVPIYRLEPEALDRERALALAEAEPSAQTRTDTEVQEALQDAFAVPGLEQLLADAVETRRQALAAERRRMREQMEIHKTSQPAEWLAGIDDLAPGSFDLLTATVLFPA